MYYSKFNYVSGYEKNSEHVLINFLSRSSDIVDEECAEAITRKKNRLPAGLAAYLKERGYIFPSKHHEAALLEKLREANRKKTPGGLVIDLDSFHKHSFRNFRSDRVCPPGEPVIIYNTRLSGFTLPLGHGNRFGIRYGTVITTADKLLSFREMLNNGSISSLFLELYPGETQLRLGEETESFLDSLVTEKMLNVNVVVLVDSNTVPSLYRLVNYFIGNGWPFHKNFQCLLKPEPVAGCFLGYWYSSPDLMKALFREYRLHPQTEYCSPEKIAGVREIHAMVWTGSPPPPAATLCESMDRLSVLSGDGTISQCLMSPLGHSGGQGWETAKDRPCMPPSSECPFMLSCGGGCQIHPQKCHCPQFGDLLELSLDYYYDELLRRSAFLEKYRESP
jgi:hypothetical protein